MKRISLYLTLAILVGLLVVPSSAHSNNFYLKEGIIPLNEATAVEATIQPYATSRNLNLDFSASEIWTWDFQNKGLIFRYENVSVEYLSNMPAHLFGSATVSLYVDGNKDGIYEPCGTTGEYTFTLKSGETLSIQIPNKSEVKNYRLVFANLNPSITSGVFSVKLW